MKNSSTTHAERFAAVEAAMNRLPVRDERRQLVGQYAFSLTFAGDVARGWPLSRIQRKEMLQLAKLADKLVAHIQTLHRKLAFGEARRMIDLAISLEPDLNKLSRAAADAEPAPLRAKAGRPRKRHAEIVTYRAAEIYEFLTGKRATRTVSLSPGHQVHGLWPTFLAEVFAALGVDASEQAQVQAHVRAKGEKSHKKSR